MSRPVNVKTPPPRAGYCRRSLTSLRTKISLTSLRTVDIINGVFAWIRTCHPETETVEVGEVKRASVISADVRKLFDMKV